VMREGVKELANSREIAVLLLIKSQEGSYSNVLLSRDLPRNIDQKDRALVTELVYGVIQQKNHLDYVISQYSKIRLRKLSPLVLNALRISVYQMLFLDRVPDFASVNESVNLIKRREGRRSANFVNAVLRNISRNKDGITYPDRSKDICGFLSVYYSFPPWLIERWTDLYGIPFTEDLCKALNERSEICIRTNTLLITPEELEIELLGEGVKLTSGKLLKEAFYIQSPFPLNKLASFRRGLFMPQDESSMLTSLALGVKVQDMVLDVAAAPGGKTTHIAQLMENRGTIVAWDIHPHRVELIKENCKRLKISNVEVEVRDSSIGDEKLFKSFDKVLVDAPCTGLGVIKRKPDIKWSKKLEDIAALGKEQQKMLKVCANYVKPGGTLVYSTCSIDPEENAHIIEDFLSKNREFVYDDLRSFLPAKLFKDSNGTQGHITLFPNVYGTDGFFIARLRRLDI